MQVVDGDKRQRTVQIRRAQNYQYTIMHYECLVNDWDVITHAPADRLRDPGRGHPHQGLQGQALTAAKVLGKHAPVRMALSGQPVENRPEELFSIMEFVDKDVLGSFHKFDRTFIERDHWGKPLKYVNLHLIQQRLGEAMYRKSREDIAEWLPEMIEIEMPVQLDPENMALHELVRQRSQQRHRQGPRPPGPRVASTCSPTTGGLQRARTSG